MGVQVPVEHTSVRRPQWLERWSYEPNVVGSNPSWNTPLLYFFIIKLHAH